MRKLKLFIRKQRVGQYMLLILLMLAGCGPATVQQQVDLFWPLPPDPPKIKYLETWRSVDDFGRSAFDVFAENIIGRESVSGLRKPQGVAVDSSGRIYVTDTALGAVVVIDKVAKTLWFIGKEGQGKLAVPIDIALDEGADRIYVSDSKTTVVNVYSMKGAFKMAIKGGGIDKTFERPTGLAIDRKLKRLYIVDTLKSKYFIYSLDGQYISSVGEWGNNEGQFNRPIYAAVNSRGEVYIVDGGNFRIQKFTPEGKFIQKFGQIGDALGHFARPKGIAIDSEDNVYVGDGAFNNFQIFNKEGQLLMFVGHGGVGPGEFQIPAGLAIDQQDRIYVVDQLNFRVQVFQYLGGRYAEAKKDSLDK